MLHKKMESKDHPKGIGNPTPRPKTSIRRLRGYSDQFGKIQN